MKAKFITFCLLISTFIGYLEWGLDRSSFIIQSEIEVLSKIFSEPQSIIHPLIILPLIGQLILLFTLLQKKPSKKLIIYSILGLGLFFVIILAGGIMSFNYKIILSTIPFFVFSILLYKNVKSNK